MRIGSLCTGYGGLDMAVEAYFNAETVWTCEFDKHASKVIDAHFDVPNHGNLKTTDWTKVEPIDILTAGYPCQPFSHAGSRKGAADERHLWPYIKEIIGLLRPRFVILENVRGHFGLGFGEVLGDLACIGYDARWRIVRASDVGAPHKRERLFVLAYPVGKRFENCVCSGKSNGSKQNCVCSGKSNGSKQNCVCSGKSNGSKQNCVCSGKSNGSKQSHFVDPNCEHRGISSSNKNNALSDSNDGRRVGSLQGLSQRYDPCGPMHLQEVPAPLDQGKLNVKFVEYMMGLPSGWVTDVDLPRAQMLKILGNGVVPQQAYRALELLHSYPQELSTGTPNLWESPKIHAVS